MSGEMPVTDAGVGSSEAGVWDASGTDLVQLRDVSVRYRVRRGLFSRDQADSILAVDRVSLSINRGRTLGLVGRTGSGKSTIAQVIMGMVAPTSGAVTVAGHELGQGEDLALRRIVQVVLQDPYSSLDPRMKVSEIIAEPLTLGHRKWGSARVTIDQRVAELLQLVGMRPNASQRYPNQFSGGQRQRIAIARALACRPQLIVLDEPTSALDVSVRAQILNLLKGLQQELGVTYLTISHDLHTVGYLAADVAVMHLGRIVEIGPTSTLFRSPRHPYTLELLSSVPGASGGYLDLPRPTEESPDALPANACRFAYRCALRTRLGNPARCMEEPELLNVQEGHRTACHFPDELATMTNA
jgi:oligopeptide/dipeptide ABC transporter ATP-binding protein